MITVRASSSRRPGASLAAFAIARAGGARYGLRQPRARRAARRRGCGIARRGELPGGGHQAKAALAQDPKNIPARLLSAQIYIDLGQGDAALGLLIRAQQDGAGERELAKPRAEAALVARALRGRDQGHRCSARRPVEHGQGKLAGVPRRGAGSARPRGGGPGGVRTGPRPRPAFARCAHRLGPAGDRAAATSTRRVASLPTRRERHPRIAG